jgi:hypothetical protein
MLPDVSREQILNAFREFDKDHRNRADWTAWEKKKNHRYAIAYDGQRYPVKKVISLATGVDVTSFSGGTEGANRYVIDLGFEVVELHTDHAKSQLPDLKPDQSIWIEITTARSELRGSGWGLGEALFSPTRNVSGADWYALMREPKAGDLVLHLADAPGDSETGKKFRGYSLVTGQHEETNKQPPNHEKEKADTFYRVPLEDFIEFKRPLPWQVLTDYKPTAVEEDARAPNSAFMLYGDTERLRLTQGRYLCRCTPSLYRAIQRVVQFARKVWCIATGRNAATNFQIALETGIWGADEEVKIAGMRRGDGLLFVTSISSAQRPPPAGFPRVPTDEFSATAESLVLGEVLSDPYRETTKIWANEVYPWRIKFARKRDYSEVSVTSEFMDSEVVDAIRLSVIQTSRAYPCWIYDFDSWNPLRQKAMPIETSTVTPQVIASSFAQALVDANITFGDDHESIVRAFLCSLMTKPFMILTGLSGSGKTQIALKLGEWLGPKQYLLVPVRPDWTGPEYLLGYEDALRAPAPDGRKAWMVPSPLAFILEAAGNPDQPYLLILDEMNLAHVERYFADILSGMESRTPVLPNLSRSGDSWFARADGSARIEFPRNLFVIGTVNVDETTYMFSPKVLDRANTLEFRVATSSLPLSFETARRPTSCPRAAVELTTGMLKVAHDDDWHVKNPPPFAEAYLAEVRALHEGLSAHSVEFGHRTFFEGLRFAAILHAAGTSAIEEALDLFVLQKLLPRLHGARRRLEPVLRSVGAFCDSARMFKNSREYDPLICEIAAARLPRSMTKIQRMMRALQANQFASFSE